MCAFQVSISLSLSMGIGEDGKRRGNWMLILCVYAALIGTVEELGASSRTRTLVREQFETNFFGPVNIIKAALPEMRKKQAGHIMILTGISP